MLSKNITRPKIDFIIERFFIIAGMIILIATLFAGLCFNKFDEQEKRKNNIQKIHNMLSQLIAPSLLISDISEIKNLLFKVSGDGEVFLIVDRDGVILMSDYAKAPIVKFVSNLHATINDCKNMEVVDKKINGKKYLVNCTKIKNPDDLLSDNYLGSLLSFSTYHWFAFSPIIVYFVVVLLFLFILITFLFKRMLYHQLLKPLITLKDNLLDISASLSISRQIGDIKNAPREIIEIKIVFERLLLSLQDEHYRNAESDKMSALIDLAVGVAHDIRSPLTALDIIIKDLKNIPESQRIVIRNAANRINDIANNLLAQYKRKNLVEAMDIDKNIKPELVSDLLICLISEKRAKHRNDFVKIILQMEENAYGKFSLLSATTFNRVMSNLIDNAIEANATEIRIELTDIAGSLLIQMHDNGCGMSIPTVKKIINGETITSKPKGCGLGLQHAIKTVEKEWNGLINIKSSINSGSCIDISLPQIYAPKWFLPFLSIGVNYTIVILDDDESIHQVWKNRFHELQANISFVHYCNPDQLIEDYLSDKLLADIFLIDFEFIGFDKTGLELIDELSISHQSYLVTSRHEDLSLRLDCENLGLKIIPKNFAVYIPIRLKPNISEIKCDLILIDDDTFITDAWVLHGASKGKEISVYNSIYDFKRDIQKYNLSVPVYIDSNLNDVISGQSYAKELKEFGFQNIYLATGSCDIGIDSLPWIKAVVGKEPPF